MSEKEEVNVFLNYEKIKENMSNIAELEKKLEKQKEEQENNYMTLKNLVSSLDILEEKQDALHQAITNETKINLRNEERIEKLEQILFLDKEIAEEECAETIIELIISQCDSNKDQAENTWDKLVKIHKRQVRDREVIWKFIEYKNEWIKDVFLHDIDKYVLTRAQKWHLVAQHIHNKKLLERLDGDPKFIRGILPEDQEEAKPHVYEMRVKDGEKKKISDDAASAVEKKESICEKSPDGKHLFLKSSIGLYYCKYCSKKQLEDGEKSKYVGSGVLGQSVPRSIMKEPTDDMANITQIIEIYDNGHEHEFYPDTHVVVKKADLEQYKKGFKEIKKEVKFINEGVQEWFLETLSGLIQNVEKYLEDKENG